MSFDHGDLVAEPGSQIKPSSTRFRVRALRPLPTRRCGVRMEIRSGPERFWTASRPLSLCGIAPLAPMISRLLRRLHLYAALLLSPWLLMYGISTLVMNHRAFFAEKHGRGAPPYVLERELTYAASFKPDASAREMARHLLASLDLDGAHTVTRRPDGTLVILRQSLVTPRRITYRPAEQKLVIESMEPRANALLERFHRRRGYGTGYLLDTVWAVTVDAVILAIVVWVGSGLWMWWGMKPSRLPGLIALLGGTALFTLFVFRI